MPKIVAVHGIGQQGRKDKLREEWLRGLNRGLQAVGITLSSQKDLACAYYADLYFKEAVKALGVPAYTARDVTEEWEKEMLAAWWAEATKVDPGVVPPDAPTKLLPVPSFAQRAIQQLCYSEYWAGVGERRIIFYLKEVYRYFHEEGLRKEIRNCIAECVDEETKVLIGHSLGSVVAYEAMFDHPEWNITTFITLGSPLGIPSLVFDRLQPTPTNGIGEWPRMIQHWTNVADRGDIVALTKELRPLFGERVNDVLVHIKGLDAHSLKLYLRTREVTHAITAGLA